MPVHLVTFATKEYRYSAELLRHTALHVGQVDRVHIWDERSVAPFSAAHPQLFQAGTRGYGYWSWKPYVILETMRMHAREGDLVVYCDAAMHFVASLQDYTGRLPRDALGLLFELPGDRPNWRWTKKATFDLMGCCTEECRAAQQLNGAVQVYRCGEPARAFLQEYLRFCTNPFCVDDSCAHGNPPGFEAHRHDQSVLSLLSVSHSNSLVLLPDCTQWGVEKSTLLYHHRKQQRPLVKVAVITPTTGTRHLERCIASVQRQSLPCVEHYVVVDGPEHEYAVRSVAAKYRDKAVLHVVALPVATGRGGWNGHRIYAALPHLVDAQYVAYLDEDNWYSPDHLVHLLQAATDARADGAFSLRNVVDKHGMFVCRDECESLGNLSPSVLAPDDFFADTSCYLLKTPLAQELGPLWLVRAREPGKPEADRAVSAHLFRARRMVCSLQHSLNYAAGSSQVSVQPSFFLEGNSRYRYRFGHLPALYLFHFDALRTQQFLDCIHDSTKTHALDEWQMSLPRGLVQHYNLVNGFLCVPMLAEGARCLVHMCHEQPLRECGILDRKGVRRVCYTVEGPNIRHQAQWDAAFLDAAFEAILTCCPALVGLPKARFCPHNTHHLDLDDRRDRACLLTNTGRERSICIVGERRQLTGTYTVNGRLLSCLDPLREQYVRALRGVSVHGQGWTAGSVGPHNTVARAGSRERDPEHSVRIMQRHVFALIVENCDAPGYVSEKIYDAWMASAIPLYHGNDNEDTALPRDMYIDLKAFPAREMVQAFLDGLTDADIEAFRGRIAAGREAVLARVSVGAYAEAVRACLEADLEAKGEA